MNINSNQVTHLLEQKTGLSASEEAASVFPICSPDRRALRRSGGRGGASAAWQSGENGSKSSSNNNNEYDGDENANSYFDETLTFQMPVQVMGELSHNMQAHWSPTRQPQPEIKSPTRYTFMDGENVMPETVGSPSPQRRFRGSPQRQSPLRQQPTQTSPWRRGPRPNQRGPFASNGRPYDRRAFDDENNHDIRRSSSENTSSGMAGNLEDERIENEDTENSRRNEMSDAHLRARSISSSQSGRPRSRPSLAQRLRPATFGSAIGTM